MATPPLTLTLDEPVPDTLKVDDEEVTKFPGPTGVFKKEEKPGAAHRFVTNFNEGFGIPQSVSENPKEAVEGVKAAVMHPGLEYDSLKEMYNNATTAQQALIDRAYNLQHMDGIGNKANGFALGVYSAIPVMGPAVVSALDKISSGDWAGGLGALTAIGTQVMAPKIATKGAEFLPSSIAEVKAIPGNIADKFANADVSVRRNMQNLTGAGPEATSEKMITDYHNKAAEAQVKQAEENASAVKANKDATVNALEEAKIRERDAKAAAAAKQQEFQTNVAEQARLASEKQGLTKQLDQASVQHGKDVENLAKAVKASENGKFDAIRSEIGNPEAPGDGLVQSVKDAQTGILQNIPENVKEFRSILGLEEKPAASPLDDLRSDVMRSQGVNPETTPYDKLPPGPIKSLIDKITETEATKSGIPLEAPAAEVKPVTWDYLQSIKSRIDAKLRKPGAMNGDLKRALFQVRDGVVDQMGKMAEDAGQGEAWQDARNTYRQYKEDFEEPTGPSGSGSPVAQVVNAVDPQNIRRPVIQKQSTIGNRHIDILSRPEYADLGGTQAAQSAQRVVDLNTQLANTPNPKPVKPVSPMAPVEAVNVKHETPKIIAQPDLPTAQDLSAMKAKEVAKTATGWKRLTRFDLLILGGSAIAPFLHGWERVITGLAPVVGEKIAGSVLSRPAVIDWISKPLPEEIRALEALPNDAKTSVRGKLKQFIEEEKRNRQGQPLHIDPKIDRFLAGQLTKKSPGEQKKDLEKMVSSNPNMP